MSEEYFCCHFLLNSENTIRVVSLLLLNRMYKKVDPFKFKLFAIYCINLTALNALNLMIHKNTRSNQFPMLTRPYAFANLQLKSVRVVKLIHYIASNLNLKGSTFSSCTVYHY